MGDTPPERTWKSTLRTAGKAFLIIAWLGFLAIVGISCGAWLTIKLNT